ncbi:MAG TPA: hypothetical protein VIW29_10760 [Polyangiaceae bacterium]
MSLPQSMPSLFGRFTAILKDHEHLGTTLRELKALCGALEAGQQERLPELQPQRLLMALKAGLSHHFGAEESEAYFGTVVTEDPALEPEIAALKAEHAAMLAAVELLLRLTEDPGRWLHLLAPTRALVLQLERHEGAESKLLRDFFFSKT